jgi:D-galactarolactone cycloisomerase
MTDLNTSVAIAHLDVLLFRAQVDRPVVTSFGSLAARPALFVQVEDTDGVRGWGEVWCNFPEFAAEERARFLHRVIAPTLEGTQVAEPSEASTRIDRLFGVQAIQAGTEGLVASLAAGVDQALWDLVARRAGEPLWRLFGGTREVRVCASSLDPEQALAMVERGLADGHQAFKLKAGFGDKTDLATVAAVRNALGDAPLVMVDANQAWNVRQAVEVADRLAEFDVSWIEEPIRADEPLRVWRELTARSRIPIATGENIRTEQGFGPLVDGRLVGQIQPDVGKWGGVTGCLQVGRRAVASGVGYSPHWLGGGIGLGQVFPLPAVRAGSVTLADQPGFGFEPEFAQLAAFRQSIE